MGRRQECGADDEDSDIEDFEEDVRSMSGGRHGRRDSSQRARCLRKSSTQSSSFDVDVDDQESDHRQRSRSTRSVRGASSARSVNNEWVGSSRVETALKERDLTRTGKRRPSTNASDDVVVSLSESDRDRKQNKDIGAASVLDQGKLVRDIIEETKKILVSDKSPVPETVTPAVVRAVDGDEQEPLKPKSKQIPQSPSPPDRTLPQAKVQQPSSELKPLELPTHQQQSECSSEEESEEEVKIEVDESDVDEVEVEVIEVIQTKSPTLENLEAIIESDETMLGPPPDAPSHEWECEHCTYVNEPNTKICAICCKTPCAKPPTLKVPTVSPLPAKLDSPAKKTKLLSSFRAAKTEPPTVSTELKAAADCNGGGTKGRIRKISFWPGTKSK